jgi:hypothetical protein
MVKTNVCRKQFGKIFAMKRRLMQRLEQLVAAKAHL